MKWPILVTIFILIFTLNGCWVNEKISVQEIRDSAAQAPYWGPSGITVLTEKEIREKIIGNTLVGPSANYGPEMVEYLQSNGSVKALWGGSSSNGYWTVSRSLMCIYYPLRFPKYPPRTASKYHCYTLTIDGEIVSYYDRYGSAVQMKSLLLTGNAKDL